MTGARGRLLRGLLILAVTVCVHPAWADVGTHSGPQAPARSPSGADRPLVLAQASETPARSGSGSVMPGAPPLRGKLVSIGSDTLGSLSSIWAESLTESYPGVRVQVRAIGSAAAPTALLEGTADLGPMSRPMAAAETGAFYRRFGYQPMAITVARDELAVFVHRSNPIESLSLKSLDAVFSDTRLCGGEAPVDRWGQLGLARVWAERSVNLYGRTTASGTYSVFRSTVLCGGDFKARMSRLVGSSAIVRAVASDVYGIGFASAGYVNAGVKRVQVTGTGENANRRMSRQLYIYINRPPGASLDPLLAAYLRLVLSESGQSRVRSAGYQELPMAERQRQLRSLSLGIAPEVSGAL
ncbi:MAG: PstS family phosphate ABC transporter substrate-binding protein [Pseudomonadota bacterium]